MAEESSNYGSIQLTPLPSSELTAKECLKLRCKLTYKLRIVKNKGAILVLVWNFLIMNIFTLLYDCIINGHSLCLLILAGVGFIPPIAGWLADVQFGRYKVIKWSIWVMWIALVIATVSSVVADFTDRYEKIDKYIFKCLYFIVVIGLGGYQANIIQFGIDQLNDASTDEIKSFVIWYAMTIIIGGINAEIVFPCLRRQQYKSLELLFVCLNVTLALLLLLCFNHWLIKEPVKQNPYKLVFKVLKYAIKNKHPRCRSAFTYCEDELPSRIDFGKSKYGGPFTTEQVEDVKTFCRLIPMILFGGAVAGGIFMATYLQYDILTHYTTYNNKSLKECYLEASFIHSFDYSALVIFLLHETFIYPTFQRCIPPIESFHKVQIGVMFQVMRVLVLMVFDVMSRYCFLSINGQNGSIPCLWSMNATTLYTMNDRLDYRWIAIPEFFQTASLVMLYTGAVEFVCAQTPSFMKGLMAGAVYCSLLISTSLLFVLSVPFQKDLPIWSTKTISCEFWYAVLLLIVKICTFLILVVLKMHYKNRRREDVLPNEHFFAERYYSRNH